MRLFATGMLICLFTALPAFGETVSVITKDNAIREDCRFFTPVRAKVQYGDSLEIVSKEGDWLRVRHRDANGCIHKSAVEEKSFILPNLTGPSKRPATSDEVAIAGKGFNPQVEDSFKKKYPELDFNAVNGIEQYDVPEQDIRLFIEQGGLNLP